MSIRSWYRDTSRSLPIRKATAAHLDALGAEEPERLLEQVQQWREIEIAPTKE